MGLSSYANNRNNALNRNGVSRLSAYHHYGMVSPFRISREAHSFGGAGADKFLDEFLVWRELAYQFCIHRRAEVEHLDALPGWAQKTLQQHATDPRDLKSAHALESGKVGKVGAQQLHVAVSLHRTIVALCERVWCMWTQWGSPPALFSFWTTASDVILKRVG